MPSEPDNAKLAREVLGWMNHDDPEFPSLSHWRKPDGTGARRPPDFAHDIAAAFMLLEALRSKGLRWSIAADSLDVECQIEDLNANGVTAYGATPAAAITAAVLAWPADRETSDG